MPLANKTIPGFDRTFPRRRGLDFLEATLVNLVSTSHWLDPARLQQLDQNADTLAEAVLPGARTALRRLVLLGRDRNLSEEGCLAGGADLIARLWAMVQ